MRRVVIDSNVYVSAALFKGPPFLFFRLATKERLFEVIFSEFIETEVKRVLSEKFSFSKLLLEKFIRLAWSKATFVTPRSTVNVCRDPADNHILECALEGQADFIVTGDKDLLTLKFFHNIQIVTPVDFIGKKLWIS